MGESLLLWDGPCRECGFDSEGYATRSKPGEPHSHYPVAIPDKAAARYGFLTVPIPDGVEVVRLGQAS